MIQNIFRTLILLAVSGLLVSGGLASNTSLQQNTSPNAVQNGSQNTNPPSNTTPNMNKAPNPKHPAAPPVGPIPPAIQAGITALESSKASLESAGDKWGGHRIKAIHLINQALKACGQTPAPQSAGTKSNNVDNPAALQAGITQLTAAQKHFTSATDSWGGRRDKALPLIKQALQELQQAASLENKPKKAR